jgi:hypothetical protein
MDAVTREVDQLTVQVVIEGCAAGRCERFKRTNDVFGQSDDNRSQSE